MSKHYVDACFKSNKQLASALAHNGVIACQPTGLAVSFEINKWLRFMTTRYRLDCASNLCCNTHSCILCNTSRQPSICIHNTTWACEPFVTVLCPHTTRSIEMQTRSEWHSSTPESPFWYQLTHTHAYTRFVRILSVCLFHYGHMWAQVAHTVRQRR